MNFDELGFDIDPLQCLQYPEQIDLIQVAMPNGEKKAVFVASHLFDPSGYDFEEILVV